MKIFKLNKVRYKNIMSVGQSPIEIQIDKCQKTLITGKNGGGKSTMLEAITFALFGKPFRDIKKGQLVNTFNKKDMLVELWMEYDNHSYYIKRGQKPNIFEIECDGEKLDESASSKEFQAYFEDLIKMSYTSFKQIVVLGTAGYTPFMGLSTPARRKLVEDLLEVSLLANMDKLNKSQVRELNQQIQINDIKKDNVVNEIKTHQEYAERQKKMSGDNVKRLQDMYDEQVKEARGYKAEIDSLNHELLDIVIGEDPSESIQEISSKTVELSTKIKSYNKVLGLYDKGGHCPTCLQDLHSSDALINQIKSHVKECNHTLEEIKVHRDELGELQSEFNSIKQRAREIKGEIASKKTLTLSAVDKAKRIKAAIDKASKEFIDNSDKIAILQKELDKIVKLKTTMVMEKYHRGIITEMLKDSGIKGSIIKKYIPLFNKQINGYLKIMEADYSFTLNEEFSETIKSRGREDFSYASFSQGEKARIDIALLFTWRDIAEKVSGIKITTLIMDEIFDSATDIEGIKSISAIIDSLKNSNVFIISHRDHDTQEYGQHLNMEKIGRFTIMK